MTRTATTLPLRKSRYVGLLLLILAVSLALRVVIAWRGGQQFWPDEDRFDVSRTIAEQLTNGDVHGAAATLFRGADHLLFKAFAVLPAWVERHWHTKPNVPALFFAAVSTWLIWLVGRVARAAGADDREALLATFLAACTSSLFYYARHFFPYDLAFAFFLLALAQGLRPGAGAGRSILVGIWISIGFLVYNGYWVVGALALALHVAAPSSDWKSALKRFGFGLLGLVAPIVVLVLIARALGFDLVTSYVKFAGGITQGDFGIAWRFIGQYFWVAEHALAVLWGLAVIVAFGGWLCRRSPTRITLWLAAVMLLYAALVLPSDAVPKFTVAARHVRVLAPFACLLTAAVLVELARTGRIGRGIVWLVVLGAGVQAGFGFARPLTQRFPRDFVGIARNFLFNSTRGDVGPYQLRNHVFLHDPTWSTPPDTDGVAVLRLPHPFQFEPYLYEGYKESMRADYHLRDMSMRIVRLNVGGTVAGGYPGALKFTVRFPAQIISYVPQPFITTGVTGAGDVFYFQFEKPYIDANLLRAGHDHWGWQAATSQPFAIDRAKDHVVVVSLGSLYPPESDPYFQGHPERRELKHRCLLIVDGQVLIDHRVDAHPSTVGEITVGMSLIGASTAADQLDAKYVAFDRLPPEEMLAWLKKK